MADNQRIFIDPDILARTATQLARVAEGLTTAATTATSARISSSALGLMNAWMVSPITSVAQRSSELIQVSSDVTGAVAIATDAAADDFATLEHNVVAVITSMGSDL
ncbi:MAG: hypothetical protein ACOH1T_02970 [Microbacteriaceae bacterium]